MTDFITWGVLATYGGALAMVMVLTQFVKDFSFVKKIPTQLVSYIFAFIVMICANAFTTGLNMNLFAQTIFNAVIVSLAANGTYSGFQRIKDGVSGSDRNNP